MLAYILYAHRLIFRSVIPSATIPIRDSRPGRASRCWIVALLLVCSIPAIAQLEEAETFDNYLLRGSEEYEKGQYSKCLATMQDFLVKFSNDPLTPRALKRVYYLLTLCSVRLAKWEEVLEWSEKYQKDTGVGAETWDSEVAFWRALANERLGRHEEAHRQLMAFVNTYGNHPKAPLARQLAGAALVQAGKWGEAADYFASLRKNLSGYAAGEAYLVELTCRLEAGQNEESLRLIDEGRTLTLPRPAAYQLLILKLADKFRVAGDSRRSIATLQRLSPKNDVIAKQEKAIVELRKDYDKIQQAEPDGLPAKLAKALLASATNGAAVFAGIPNFDSTARYRMASAFMAMKRYREAAQVLADMLQSLPPDEVVERASDSVVRNYFETKQWEKTVATAASFERKFSASDALPGVLLLKGQALQELEKYDEADKTFSEIIARFPRHELAPHAMFSRAFSSIWQEDYPRAMAGFDEVITRFPESPSADPSLFWKAQAHSLARQWPETIVGMKAYLAKYPDGVSTPEAQFRIAFAEHALRNYEVSIPAVRAFLDQHPSDPNRAEACLILADGLLAQGDMEGGLAALQATPKGGGSFREEAWFRRIKVQRLLEDWEAMRKLVKDFLVESPKSARVAEAVYWEGWTYRDDPVRQREVFFEAIRRYGTDPSQWGVAEMIRELVKAGPDSVDTLQKFFAGLAEDQNPRSLQLWGTWAQAQLDRSDRGNKLAGAAPLVIPNADSPLVMLDIADALRAAGQREQATALYQEVRRWNPVNPNNDRAFAALGLIAWEQGDAKAALGFFDRFLKETPGSRLRGEVLVRSADALAKEGRMAEAAGRYDEALAEKATPRRLKAEALVALGRLHIDNAEPRKAAPYFQRVFVLYGAYPDLAAQAYLGSADAMAKMGEPVEEARVLLEFAGREDLAGPEPEKAREKASLRLAALPEEIVSQAKEKNTAAELAEAQAAYDAEGKR